jgi:hypothetical protein
MLERVTVDLKSRLPEQLVDALFTSYEGIKQNFFLEKHEPSELNGGKFCEACLRILQYETSAGNYTPLGVHIPNIIGKLRDFEQLPSVSANESYRVHIPRVLISMYNIRNKRGVGHIGGDVNPNCTDSTYLVACADWVMAELFRIHYRCSLEEAQGIVDLIVQRSLTLVHELERIKRVLLPSLSHRDQTLILLASASPKRVPVSDLIAWIEPANKSRYRNSVLRKLHSDRFVELNGSGWCVILPPGLKHVETHYNAWLAKLENKEG